VIYAAMAVLGLCVALAGLWRAPSAEVDPRWSAYLAALAEAEGAHATRGPPLTATPSTHHAPRPRARQTARFFTSMFSTRA